MNPSPGFRLFVVLFDDDVLMNQSLLENVAVVFSSNSILLTLTLLTKYPAPSPENASNINGPHGDRLLKYSSISTEIDLLPHNNQYLSITR